MTSAHIWQSITCQVLIDQLECLISKKQKDATVGRIQAWKKKLRDSFDIYRHGAAAFRWLNSKAPVNLQAVSTAEGGLATDTNEMLDSIAPAWQNLFHENDLVNLDSFEIRIVASPA